MVYTWVYWGNNVKNIQNTERGGWGGGGVFLWTLLNKHPWTRIDVFCSLQNKGKNQNTSIATSPWGLPLECFHFLSFSWKFIGRLILSRLNVHSNALHSCGPAIHHFLNMGSFYKKDSHNIVSWKSLALFDQKSAHASHVYTSSMKMMFISKKKK